MGLPGLWRMAPGNVQTVSGQAIVYKVVHRDREGDYALKRLKNADRRDRFAREIEQMELLGEHGVRVPPIVEKDVTDARPWYVMPWYPLGDLDTIILGDERHEITELLRLALQIGTALKAIHQENLAHRDIKPANILRDGDGIVLADFGLCLSLDDDRWTASAEAVGPRLYIAPENEGGMNESNNQRPADCYAFGKLLWAMLAGRTALRREDQLLAANRLDVVHSEPRLHRLNPIFERLLDTDPRSRLGNWSQVLAELTRTMRSFEGSKNSAGSGQHFDTAPSIAKAGQLAARSRRPEQREADRRRRERMPYEAAIRELIKAKMVEGLQTHVSDVNAASDGYLNFSVGPHGRPLDEMIGQDFFEFFEVPWDPNVNRSETPVGSLNLYRPYTGSDQETITLAAIVLSLREEEVFLFRTPLRRWKMTWDYPRIDPQLGFLAERVGPLELRLEGTKDIAVDFASRLVDVGHAIIDRYVDLAVADDDILNEVINWSYRPPTVESSDGLIWCPPHQPS